MRVNLPGFRRRLHAFLMVFWAVMLVPTLFWWKESILWIAIVSIYANFVGHWDGFEAAKGKEDK